MTPPPQYRTFWRRFWAGWIDSILFLPLLFVHLWTWGNVTNTTALVIWFIVLKFSYVTYSILLHGYFGQTIGKRVMGIRVLDVSESKLSLRQAVLRDCVPLVFIAFSVTVAMPLVLSGQDPHDIASYSSGEMPFTLRASQHVFSVWMIAELTTMMLNSKRRAVHDFIAGSVVVRRVVPR